MGSPIEPVYGPILIGMIIVLLYGVMITQTYLYWATFKRERIWLKAFVWVLFLANTLRTVFDVAFIYDRLIYQFGDLEKIFMADWIFNTEPAMTAIIASMVQLFFAWRIKLITGSKVLTFVIVICSVVQVLGGLGTGIACGIVKPFVEFKKFSVIVIIWLSFSALTDVLIAIVLAMGLHRNRTGFAATDDVIDRLIQTTVQTGALTAAVAIIDLVLFLVKPESGLHLAFNFPLAHLYANSLLSTLNSRALGTSSSRSGGGATSTSDYSIRHASRQRGGIIDLDLNNNNRTSKVVISRGDGEERELNDIGGVTTKVFIDRVTETTVSPA